LGDRILHERQLRLVALAICLWIVGSACATPIGVKRVDPSTVHRMLTGSILSTGEPSIPTRNVLYRLGLHEAFDDDPEPALAALHGIVVRGEGGPHDLSALAELSFLHAEKAGKRSYFLASAVYAYAYLFPDDAAEAPDPLDPRLRMTCELYNRAITRGFEKQDGFGLDLRGGTYELPFGDLVVDLDEPSLRWRDRQFVEFEPVAELEVRGLRSRYRQAGIGAPLAAKTAPLDPSRGFEDFVGPRVKVPVTAFLRIEHPRAQLAAAQVHSTLELHVALESGSVQIEGRKELLEVEPTAALASTLAEAPIWEREIWGFLQRVGAVDEKSRLIALRPYKPGLIPVVFVHGTASSAARWAEMTNDLENDPSIYPRFQFWYFSYDTGNPILYSAMLLREALERTVERLDPEQRDAALQKMVVIGHSQGGLLTKLVAVDSGTRFWENASKQPFESARMSERSRDLLRRAMFLQPLPFAKRLVFVATPQRGSYVAGNPISHWVSRFINMPLDLAQTTGDLVRRNPDTLAFASLTQLPTSVSNMTPGSPFIRVLESLPLAPGVKAHSIIAVNGDGPVEGGNDGVVAYASAHVDGVESEFVVRSPHSCQDNPHTIQEVRRILLEHAALH
jgi:pimeloyl-ACP methyl ester carboxylesterase